MGRIRTILEAIAYVTGIDDMKARKEGREPACCGYPYEEEGP